MSVDTKRRIAIHGFNTAGLQALVEAALGDYDQVVAEDSHGLMLESVTMEEIEHHFLGDGEIMYQRSAMFEAITTERQQLAQTMRAFIKVLNRGLNGTNITAGDNSGDSDTTGASVGGAILSKVRRVAGIPVIAAKIPLSDGQSTSIVFHSPTSNGTTVAGNDLMVAFQFLVNKRDVTHTVAPIGGKDMSLAQVAQSISNLIEKNSAKFQNQQALQAKTKDEIASVNAAADKLEDQRSDLMNQLNAADADASKADDQVTQLQKSLASQKSLNADLQQQLDKISSAPAPTPAPGSEITDNLRTVKQNINLDGQSKLSDGSLLSVKTIDAGEPETLAMLTTPDGTKYQLQAKSMQGTAVNDAVGKLFKAYRGGTAKKYQVEETAEDKANAANAATAAATGSGEGDTDNPDATGDQTGKENVPEKTETLPEDANPEPKSTTEPPDDGQPDPNPEPETTTEPPEDKKPDPEPEPAPEATGAQRTYRYALTLRPAGPGAVPAGNVGLQQSESGDPYAKYARYGYIEYPEKLSDKDAGQFDLTYMPTPDEYVSDAQKLAQSEFADRAEAMIEFATEQPQMFAKTVQIRFRNVFPDTAYPQGDDAATFDHAFQAALEAIANPKGDEGTGDGATEAGATGEPPADDAGAAGDDAATDGESTVATEKPPEDTAANPPEDGTDPMNQPTTTDDKPDPEKAATPAPDNSATHEPDPIDLQQLNIDAIAKVLGRSSDAVANWWEANGNGPDGLTAIKSALESAPTQENIDALNNAVDFGTAFTAAAIKPEAVTPPEGEPADTGAGDASTDNKLTGNNGDDDVPETDKQTNAALDALKDLLNYKSDDLDDIQSKLQQAQSAANALVEAGEYDANESLVNDVAENLIGLLAAIQQKGAA